MSLLSRLRRNINYGSTSRLGDIVNDLHGVKLTVGPTSGTPGTSLVVPHGLTDFTGTPVAPWDINVCKGNLYIVSYDATNVTVASSAATQSGELVLVPSDPGNYLTSRRT